MELKESSGVQAPQITSSIHPRSGVSPISSPSFWPRGRWQFCANSQVQEWGVGVFEQTMQLSLYGEGVERMRRAKHTLFSCPTSETWLKMKPRKYLTWDRRQKFSTREGSSLFCVVSSCLFALVTGSDQEALESMQVFVKEFSNLVYKIGSNRRKIKDFMFLLHNVWATE